MTENRQEFELVGLESTTNHGEVSGKDRVQLGGTVREIIRLSNIDPDHEWQDDANCLGVGLNLFFPERGVSTSEAKEVCRDCPVRNVCLEYAIVNSEKFGVWGGLSERERRRIRRTRAQIHRKTLAE